MGHVVVVEVAVADVGGGLVVAGDGGGVGDDVLLGQHAQGQQRDEVQGLPALVAHEAHGALVDHLAQGHEVVVLAPLLLGEVVLQVGLQLPLLLEDVGEVDEEARAHVALQGLDLLLVGGPEVPHQQVAVLEQPPAPDLLGVLGGDESVLQVVQRLLEVPVHALPDDRGVQLLGQGLAGAAVEEKQGVQDDLERVHAELELAPDGVDELELHIAPVLVGEGDEAPAVRVRAHLHQLLDVGLLQGRGADLELAHALRQEVQQRAQHHIPDQLKLSLCGQSHVKDEVQVFAAQPVVFDQDMAGRRAVQPDILHFDACLLQPATDSLHDVLECDLQGGEVASSVDGYHLSQDLVQTAHLVPGEHAEGHAVPGTAALLCHLGGCCCQGN